MSRSLNKWMGIGNCCADPEVRFGKDNNAIANITVACNNSYKDKNTGELVENAEFVRVVMFGKLGEIAGEYLKKGSKIYVEGRLQSRQYEDKEGQTRYITEIVANEMLMLDGKER